MLHIVVLDRNKLIRLYNGINIIHLKIDIYGARFFLHWLRIRHWSLFIMIVVEIFRVEAKFIGTLHNKLKLAHIWLFIVVFSSGRIHVHQNLVIILCWIKVGLAVSCNLLFFHYKRREVLNIVPRGLLVVTTVDWLVSVSLLILFQVEHTVLNKLMHSSFAGLWQYCLL